MGKNKKKEVKELSELERAELIEKGARLDRKIKKATAELTIIKSQMQNWEPKLYAVSSGETVKIEETKAYEDLDAVAIYKWFKKNKMSSTDFLRCVKVLVENTKKMMGEAAFSKFRKEKKIPGRKITFTKMPLEQIEAESGKKFSTDTRMLKI